MLYVVIIRPKCSQDLNDILMAVSAGPQNCTLKNILLFSLFSSFYFIYSDSSYKHDHPCFLVDARFKTLNSRRRSVQLLGGLTVANKHIKSAIYSMSATTIDLDEHIFKFNNLAKKLPKNSSRIKRNGKNRENFILNSF